MNHKYWMRDFVCDIFSEEEVLDTILGEVISYIRINRWFIPRFPVKLAYA